MGSFEASIKVREVGNKNVSYDINSDLNGEVTLKQFLDFTKRTLLTIARDTLIEEQGKGFDKKPIVVVDGNVRKPILNVSPLGKIEFVSTKVVATDVIIRTYKNILEKSPVDTGQYSESNYVFFNGTRVATNITELEAWVKTKTDMKKGDTIQFLNVVPYARKLERLGTVKGKSRRKLVKSRDKQKRSGETILGPNGVYFLCSRIALRDYKNNLKIRFEFVLGSSIGPGNFPAIGKNGKPLRRNYKPSKLRPKNSGPYLYPSIKMVIQEVGLV